MPELGFVGFRLGFANPRFELRQLMGVTPLRFVWVSEGSRVDEQTKEFCGSAKFS